MIPIVAKDYNHFFLILESYGINEEDAIFIPADKEPIKFHSEKNIINSYSSNDWTDYQCFG